MYVTFPQHFVYKVSHLFNVIQFQSFIKEVSKYFVNSNESLEISRWSYLSNYFNFTLNRKQVFSLKNLEQHTSKYFSLICHLLVFESQVYAIRFF
jgi:hypothetical protein